MKKHIIKIVKQIATNERLGYIYTEKELINIFSLTLDDFINQSINHCIINLKHRIAIITFNIGTDYFITIHIILR